ncbi:MAG: CPBP family intramembrane metalloprotease, partial [Ignavibacteriae bacterium]|nr:CPBP family intramembrane metalloprotease [Ignavibacteriota bacterium]
PEYRGYALRYASNLLPGLVVIAPLAIYWYNMDRATSSFYGFSASKINLKTYFAILLLVAPVVCAASFGGDFQATYPRYKFGMPTDANSLAIPGFELCYGIDFVFVELLFRGFMVMAFTRYLGSGAILPMVVVYAFIHFQKPMGEAIGSVFGGIVLGVISYNTKSIYGGVILHLGVAYMMEAAGTLQMLYRSAH